MHLQYILDSAGNATGVYIPINDWDNLTKQFREIRGLFEEQEPTKNEILANIKQGLKEVQLIEQGKMKSTPLKEFLDGL